MGGRGRGRDTADGLLKSSSGRKGLKRVDRRHLNAAMACPPAPSCQLLGQLRVQVQRERDVCERCQRQHHHLSWVLPGAPDNELCCRTGGGRRLRGGGWRAVVFTASLKGGWELPPARCMLSLATWAAAAGCQSKVHMQDGAPNLGSDRPDAPTSASWGRVLPKPSVPCTKSAMRSLATPRRLLWAPSTTGTCGRQVCVCVGGGERAWTSWAATPPRLCLAEQRRS